MRAATKEDKQLVVHILTTAFDENTSVNYIVRNDSARVKRIRALMEYSFNECLDFGTVVVSDDECACALLLYPELKQLSMASLQRSLRLIFQSTGLLNIRKVLSRESKIKALQPELPFHYLWFIGVLPGFQGRGIGMKLLNDIVNAEHAQTSMLCLETSSERNLRFYAAAGFKLYNELDLGYDLFFLKKELK